MNDTIYKELNLIIRKLCELSNNLSNTLETFVKDHYTILFDATESSTDLLDKIYQHQLQNKEKIAIYTDSIMLSDRYMELKRHRTISENRDTAKAGCEACMKMNHDLYDILTKVSYTMTLPMEENISSEELQEYFINGYQDETDEKRIPSLEIYMLEDKITPNIKLMKENIRLLHYLCIMIEKCYELEIERN